MSSITAVTHQFSSSHPSIHPFIHSLSSPSLCPFCTLDTHFAVLHIKSLLCPLILVIPWHYLFSLFLYHFFHSGFTFFLLVYRLGFFFCPYRPLTLLSSLPFSAAQAGSPMDQCSYRIPRGFQGHIDPTDIPAERSQSTLMPMCCTQL